jgi:hypothetical protein
MLYPSLEFEAIDSCLTDQGCGRYPSFNKECAEINKDAVLKCCHNICLTSETEDCQEICRGLYQEVVGTRKPEYTDILQKYNINKAMYKENSGKKNSWHIYFIVGILAILIPLAIVVIVQSYKKIV